MENIAKLKPPKLEMVMLVFVEIDVVFSIDCAHDGNRIQSFPILALDWPEAITM
jgi:hypothetical protein